MKASPPASARVILFALFLVSVSWLFTSCEGLLGNCKVCSLNTYESGVLIQSQNEAEYCDANLVSIQSIPPQVSGNLETKWECK